jgi:hypothetical protein
MSRYFFFFWKKKWSRVLKGMEALNMLGLGAALQYQAVKDDVRWLA